MQPQQESVHFKFYFSNKSCYVQTYEHGFLMVYIGTAVLSVTHNVYAIPRYIIWIDSHNIM